MSSRTKKSFAWLWMAALLTATVGINVQQIYCYCAGETTVSLFAAEDACANAQRTNESDCCSKQKPSPAHSCCDETSDKTGLSECGGCTHKSTKVFQLKTEFVVDKPLEKNFDCPIWLWEMPLYRHYLRPAMCEAIFRNKPPPPPLSGRDICLRHQLYRC